MALQLTNKFGVIDLAAIRPEEVQKLDESQQQLLASLIAAVEAREAAALRLTNAVRAVGVATAEQIEAAELHIKANPPPTFQEIHAASVRSYRPQ